MLFFYAPAENRGLYGTAVRPFFPYTAYASSLFPRLSVFFPSSPCLPYPASPAAAPAGAGRLYLYAPQPYAQMRPFSPERMYPVPVMFSSSARVPCIHRAAV